MFMLEVAIVHFATHITGQHTLFESEDWWHIIYAVNTAEFLNPVTLGLYLSCAMCNSCLKCLIFDSFYYFRTFYHSGV